MQTSPRGYKYGVFKTEVVYIPSSSTKLCKDAASAACKVAQARRISRQTSSLSSPTTSSSSPPPRSLITSSLSSPLLRRLPPDHLEDGVAFSGGRCRGAGDIYRLRGRLQHPGNDRNIHGCEWTGANDYCFADQCVAIECLEDSEIDSNSRRVTSASWRCQPNNRNPVASLQSTHPGRPCSCLKNSNDSRTILPSSRERHDYSRKLVLTQCHICSPLHRRLPVVIKDSKLRLVGKIFKGELLTPQSTYVATRTHLRTRQSSQFPRL